MTVLKEHLMRHPSDRDTLQALISFSRDAGNFAVALEYAEQLARVAPNDPSLTLIDNLRRQIRMHEDGEPLPATDKFVGCVSCVSDGYAGSHIIDKHSQLPDRCLRWCAGTLSARSF